MPSHFASLHDCAYSDYLPGHIADSTGSTGTLLAQHATEQPQNPSALSLGTSRVSTKTTPNPLCPRMKLDTTQSMRYHPCGNRFATMLWINH